MVRLQSFVHLIPAKDLETKDKDSKEIKGECKG